MSIIQGENHKYTEKCDGRSDKEEGTNSIYIREVEPTGNTKGRNFETLEETLEGDPREP